MKNFLRKLGRENHENANHKPNGNTNENAIEIFEKPFSTGEEDKKISFADIRLVNFGEHTRLTHNETEHQQHQSHSTANKISNPPIEIICNKKTKCSACNSDSL